MYFSRDTYASYIEKQLAIMRERYSLCEKVIAHLPTYDYWSYNYANYLCTLNLEQLNSMRYLFGESIHTFFEFKMLMASKTYCATLQKFGKP